MNRARTNNVIVPIFGRVVQTKKYANSPKSSHVNAASRRIAEAETVILLSLQRILLVKRELAI